ncbi:PorV/PorQ family protein [Hymenobacter qilianensis]|uniref:PorV/PorQ family protein n=1 Tax=Hymenobacter qilianensis TaxID=1385715 RepID=UPI001CB915CF|nr:PorV/PorQ family protein [Hymenobacter qilianensis]
MLPAFAGVVLGAILVSQPAAAQIGGQQAFTFLNLPPSAKLAGLGGVNVSSRDADATMMYGNPALLNADMDNRLALGYVDYLSDIKQSTAAYVFNTKSLGRLGVGLTYLNYGRFEQFDAAGTSLGEFSVNEYALGVSDAYTSGNFTLAGTLKLAVSGIAGNHSLAALVDVGGIFKHPTQDFTVGLTVRNVGYQFQPYAGADREPMPLDVQLGLPLSLSICLCAFPSRRTIFSSWILCTSTLTSAGSSTKMGWKSSQKRHWAIKLPGTLWWGANCCLARTFICGRATITCSAASCASKIPRRALG